MMLLYKIENSDSFKMMSVLTTHWRLQGSHRQWTSGLECFSNRVSRGGSGDEQGEITEERRIGRGERGGVARKSNLHPASPITQSENLRSKTLY